LSRKLDFDKFLLFDGAMGTMLQASGMKGGELAEACLDLAEVISVAVTIARRTAGERLVALDIGPLGQLMEPYGSLSFEATYQAFAEQVRAGQAAGADLILIETMSDLYEAKAAILAAKENAELPIFCTMTFQADGRTLTGADPLTVVNVLQSLGVTALGINCSLGPKEILPLVRAILEFAQVPVMVQPNAGLPQLKGEKTVFRITPADFAAYGKEIAMAGARILGGCCGTTPDHIKALKEALRGLRPVERKAPRLTAASSGTSTVILGDEIKIIGERLNPTLGVSNVSFGLPARHLLNRTFLAAALAAGLDAPIMNPMDAEMRGTVRAFNVLWNHDRDSKAYLKAYSTPEEKPAPRPEPERKELKELIVAGELFLPQLIRATETVKRGFAVIKEDLRQEAIPSAAISKGKIVFATVKGDIHDIGKNIVKILLENYGFDVYDLGKDVPGEAIIMKVREERAALVGLSALMTTTVRNMAETIKALRQACPQVKIMVGGAVLNEDYAQRIGADFYGKDAREAVKIAEKIFRRKN